MEREISSIAMLGIVLLAVAIIIGLGFGIFSIAKGTANEGVVNMQDSLAYVRQSTFTDYDQKIVTGTQVISAYNRFEGTPYAILISTRAFISGEATANNEIRPDSPSGPTQGVRYNDLTVPAMTKTMTGSFIPMTALNNKGQSVNLVFINYNALLDANAEIVFDNGAFVTSSPFSTESGGVIKFNNIIGGLSRSGNSEYIPPSARFQATLIKDASGTIMGIAFQQIGSN